jgi:hypothetical protein
MTEKKKTTVTPEIIADFLQQTGFVFEMRVHQQLRQFGYKCDVGYYFLDLAGDVEREIDIVARKVVNDILIHLVIECKQSLLDKWVFIANKRSRRYYYSVKHLPNVPGEMMKQGLFDHLHNFDGGIPLTDNYICYSVTNGKKTEHLQIDECVHKLPKALLDIAASVKEGRHLFLPVALFSGQIFSAAYKERVLVQERTHIQYLSSFRSLGYQHAVTGPRSKRVGLTPFAEYEEGLREKRQAKIREITTKLAAYYSIDFVTEAGFAEYVQMIEKEVAAVKIEQWNFPAPTAESVQTVTESGNKVSNAT